MNTSELITSVRNSLVEYQITIVDDNFVISFLNHAYRKLYNHFARASDNHFGEVFDLDLSVGVNEYELPRNMWSKRIDYLAVPTPGADARGWVNIPKIDYKDRHKFDLPATFATIPNAWAQLNNTIYLYPNPQRIVTARLLYIPPLVPLKKTEGVVLSFSSPTLICIENLSSEFAALAASTVGEGFLSICDGVSGVVKHVMRYSSVTNNAITLANPAANRNQIKGTAFSTLTSDLTDIQQDDVIVSGLGTGVSLMGEAFDEFLINYATLAIKSALNENDVTLKEQLKDLMQEYKSDRVGRPGIETIERVNRFPQFLGNYRRSR